jgi:hypothetical protein
MTHFEQLEKHLLDDVLVFANLIQIPAVILTGGAAWLVCRPIRRWTTSWVERVQEHHHLDWVVSKTGPPSIEIKSSLCKPTLGNAKPIAIFQRGGRRRETRSR